MKKFFTLTLALLASFSLWATDPDVAFTMSTTTTGDYFKNYTVGSYTVTVFTSASSISSGNGGYYIDLGSASSDFGSNYLGVKVTGGAIISKVEILASGSGNNKSITAPVIGWEDGWDEESTTADAGLTLSYTTPGSNGSKYSTAEWREADVASWDAKEVRIYKKLSSVTVTGYTLPTSGETVRVWGVRVYLGVSTPVCPSGLSISGTQAYTEGDKIELTAALTAGNGDITYQWYKGGTAEANKLTGKTNKKLEIEDCATTDAGDYYCVASKTDCSDAVNASAYAVTVAADTRCFIMPSITSTPADLASVDVTGGSLEDVSINDKTVSMKGTGLGLGGNDSRLKVKLTSSSIVEGTKITIAYKEANKDGAGLAIFNGDYANKTLNASSLTGAGSVSHTFTAAEAANYDDEFIIDRNGSGKSININAITVEDCGSAVTRHTVTLDYNDGSTPAGSISVVDGRAAQQPANPTWVHHRFNEWQLNSAAYNFSTPVTADITLVANWIQLYTISFANGGGSGDAPEAIDDKAQGETFEVPENTYTAPTGQVFDHWYDGTNNYEPSDTYTVGTSNVTLTAVWRTPAALYAITKGNHENGDFTIDPATQEEGGTVTLVATPNADYLFSEWEVVKTLDGSATGITVDASGQFEMPAYAVTVNATFVADNRKKVLYVTSNDEATTKSSDKLYEALKDDYNIKIVGPTSSETVTKYALVVLHESVAGSNHNAAAVAAAKGGAVPVLNTKAYFYNSDRWNWGTPNAGKTVKGATLNSAYSNIASHPIFAGVTVSDGFFEITDEALAKCMQPIGSFAAGKEGYTLATTPNNNSGNGCAIHELTPAQRGVASGKYLMISVLGDKLSALNANGQKLFQNAAAYLISNATWTPTYAVTFGTPEGGTLVVKQGGVAITSGDLFEEGTVLTVEATPDDDHTLTALTAGGTNILASKQFTVGTSAVTVSATFTEKPDAPISWMIGEDEITELTIYLDKEYTLPTLSNAQSLTVDLASTNESVAVFNAGELKITGVGNATISAEFDGNDTYKATTASYALNVVEKYPTGVENAEAGMKAVKVLKNGVLIIEKNGKKYNIIGSEIR